MRREEPLENTKIVTPPLDKRILDDFTSASLYPSDCPQLFSDIFFAKKKKKEYIQTKGRHFFSVTQVIHESTVFVKNHTI